MSYHQGQPRHEYFYKKCRITSKINRTSNISLFQFMVVRQKICILTGAHCQERQHSVLLPKKWSSLFYHVICPRYHYLNPVLVCSFLPAEITRKLRVFQNMPFWSRLSRKCVKREVNQPSPRPLGATPQKKTRKAVFHDSESSFFRTNFSFFCFFYVENRPLNILSLKRDKAYWCWCPFLIGDIEFSLEKTSKTKLRNKKERKRKKGWKREREREIKRNHDGGKR